MSRTTDCDRLLAVLSDGRPHNHLELYGLNMIVHSRVADLRKRGYTIESWRERHVNGTRYWYQLLPPLTKEEAVVPAGSSSVSGSVLDEQGFVPGGTSACGHASIEPLQLSIGEAA